MIINKRCKVAASELAALSGYLRFESWMQSVAPFSFPSLPRTPNGLTMLRLRGHTPFLCLGLSLDRLQVQHYRCASHIEEVLASPLVPCSPTLASSQVGQAMLHLYPLAQLHPARPRRRPLPQPVLEGLVLGNAHRAPAPQRRPRALRPQRTVVTLGSRELHHRP